ncbi:hypothetical protein FRB90_004370 [Tulasnella sp. 427]|nr:hypothetical protein FRB90_004370 [Tulasnella sp. 427]
MSPPGRAPVHIHRMTSTNVDPFSQTTGISSFFKALMATTLFRCWHIIALFALWATIVSVISDKVKVLSLPSTLITVFGTVLGFVISYRTSSSFERYNEGRRYWSSVVLASRLLARTIWIHVPPHPPPPGATEGEKEQARIRGIIEKKSAINLIEAFAVAVKHYLRGEDAIFYEDLYNHVKFLPGYTLPAGLGPRSQSPVNGIFDNNAASTSHATYASHSRSGWKAEDERREFSPYSANDAPEFSPYSAHQQEHSYNSSTGRTLHHTARTLIDIEKGAAPTSDPAFKPLLLPSKLPPKRTLFDVFPLSLLVKPLLRKGRAVAGQKAAKVKAKQGNVNHNVPLEITFYLASYVFEIQRRKDADVPTLNLLLANLNALGDALTGLERILTTPIPFSYTIHLWAVATIFVTLLPFQLWTTFHYTTIPATSLAAFIFFGFLVAGEEIENPFGYDMNDLNLDHFTQNIIRVELDALTSRPPPSLDDWAFSSDNDQVFGKGESPATPAEWMERGETAVWTVLKRGERGVPDNSW